MSAELVSMSKFICAMVSFFFTKSLDSKENRISVLLASVSSSL